MGATRQDSRANQKARTRAAIVAAAHEHRSAHGATPSVAEAAAAAGVARATAYRYFPTQEALEVEVAGVTPDVAAVEAALEKLPGTTPEERVLALLDVFNPVVLEREEDFRRALWVYLDTWLRNRRAADDAPAVREGRRTRWLETALGPLDELPDDRRRRLHAALALTLGGDPMVVMKDVCGLDDDEALAVLRWTAQAILHAALDEKLPA
ncbi:MAG TPA: TetR family transcriptional regulator [Gaiellaceae bacterium]|nr:TetR family transcriptional regulator [Gaiellaceae bacterium]